MSEETQAENVETQPENTNEDQPQLVASSPDGITTFNGEIHSRKVRGKEEQESIYMLRLQTDKWNDLQKFAEVIGTGTFLTCIVREVIKAACTEASSEAFDDEKRFNQVKFWEAVKDWFKPATRRKGGPKLAEIDKEMAGLAGDRMSIVLETQASGGVMNEENQNRAMQIQLRLAALNTLKAKKERRGKKKDPVTAPVPA